VSVEPPDEARPDDARDDARPDEPRDDARLAARDDTRAGAPPDLPPDASAAAPKPAARYRVRHVTRYVYEGEVAHAHQVLHLTPRTTERQKCFGHAILVHPAAMLREDHVDAFGNGVTRLELDRPHGTLDIIATMEVAIAPLGPIDPARSESWEGNRESLQYSAQNLRPQQLDVLRFAGGSLYVPIKRMFEEYALEVFPPDTPVLVGAEALMQKIHHEFEYSPGATEIATPLVEVFTERKGVCQDYAHLMIACLRSLGLAARYVSGYLRTHTDADEALTGADASHAWVSVWAPPFGWVDLDPTNNLRVDQDHVVLAWGRDFGDVSPLRGVLLGGGSHSLEVAVVVAPLAA
jgi:transglutaminase-like putative cysteine protease